MFFDTNVLVSALLNSNGPPAAAWAYVRTGVVRLVVDERVLNEYAEVLSRQKFNFPTEDRDALLALARSRAKSVIARRWNRSRRRDLRSDDLDTFDSIWAKLEKLIASSAYDDAMLLAVDLRSLAERDGTMDAFSPRFNSLRLRQLRRRGFFDRWKHTYNIAKW